MVQGKYRVLDLPSPGFVPAWRHSTRSQQHQTSRSPDLGGPSASYSENLSIYTASPKGMRASQGTGMLRSCNCIVEYPHFAHSLQYIWYYLLLSRSLSVQEE